MLPLISYYDIYPKQLGEEITRVFRTISILLRHLQLATRGISEPSFLKRQVKRPG